MRSPELLAGLVVVGADVKEALRLGRIRVEGDELASWRRSLSSAGTWSLRRDHADRDAVVALAGQVLEDLVLLLGRAVGGHLDVDLDLGFLFVLVDARCRDLPELAGCCW